MSRGAGRPLRFLMIVAGGWTGMRVAMVWKLGLAAAPPPERAAAVPTPVANAMQLRSPAASRPPAGRFAIASPRTMADRIGGARRLSPSRERRSAAVLVARADAAAGEAPSGPLPALRAPDPPAIQPIASPAIRPATLGAAPPSRWQGSFWLLLRGQGTAGPSSFGDGVLGASQTGLRIGRTVDPARRLAVYGRVSSALEQPGAEAAFGLDWRPTPLPVHLIAEQRVPIDRGRGGPTLGVIGGQGPSRLIAGFTLESYGEAGVILRDGGVGFADGAARVSHGVARLRRVALTLGGGIWGAVQPGARRLDIGPTLVADVPVAARHLRLSVDWRARVTGNARPASGPALTLGADF